MNIIALKDAETQEMETVYSNIMEKVPSSGRKKCSPTKLLFIQIGQIMALFLLLIIVSALLFIMDSRTSERMNNIVQSILQARQNGNYGAVYMIRVLQNLPGVTIARELATHVDGALDGS
ncbi:hypothetical protein XELAEV_18018900mg [Xenopus laevis]|uniref:Uncharacterized protein n=1 Tax=Xenopus laevis TaxID=8355 RepID=A0A974HU70_XENLA|nr:hypothetical protein XELAEV_18018900mg [Xenopus laevis]